ncbi:MAG: HlyD family efflux transporter periplasmic adaptor subunit [Victivallaceae bacterium]|nr:HlyD family efflux transporter periplasmic adaptor subunit [Victivallaceae bacterium]
MTDAKEESQTGPETTPPPQQQPGQGIDYTKLRTGELRSDLEVFEGGPDEAGNPGWIVHDPVSGNYFRIGEEDYRILKSLDQEMTVADFLEKLARANLPSEAGKVIAVLRNFERSGLMKHTYQTTAARVQATRMMKRKMWFQRLLSAYMSFRIPLWAPDPFIRRTLPAVQKIFNSYTLVFLKLLAVIGYASLAVNFYKFAGEFMASISLGGLFRYSLAIIVIKIIHEFAHAYTASSFDCRVRKMGIAFIFFFPRLFTDLTDAWRIKNSMTRFRIDGAGIFCELIIGGIAALVWANTAGGAVNAVAYYIFAVSIINTLLVNGNFFIRYDGYYMLMDLVNIDNLQKRSSDLVRDLWRGRLFGLPVHEETARGFKRLALFAYGVCSFVYRIFLYLSIVLLVYFQFAKAIGIVLLILEVYLMILRPLVGEVIYLWKQRRQMRPERKLLSGAVFLGIALILLLPLPWNLTGSAMVRETGGYYLYVPIDGFLLRHPPGNGDPVRQGDVLLELEDPRLDFQMRMTRLDRTANALRLDMAQRSAQMQGEVPALREQLRQTENELTELERRRNEMWLRSPIAGDFLLLNKDAVKGKFLRRGELIGEVVNRGEIYVEAFFSEDDVGRLSVGDRATLWLNGRLETVSGTVIFVDQSSKLPDNPAFFSIYGGSLAVLPDDNGTYTAVEAYYRVLIAPGAKLPPGQMGKVKIRKFTSVAGNLLRNTIRVLRRELTF